MLARYRVSLPGDSPQYVRETDSFSQALAAVQAGGAGSAAQCVGQSVPCIVFPSARRGILIRPDYARPPRMMRQKGGVS
jgi:hypothetical protein